MILPLAYYGNPILRKKAAPVTDINDDLRKLVANMDETLMDHNGAGLAAPQVQHSIALFLTSFSRYVKDPNHEEGGYIVTEPTRVFINPKIISYSEEIWELEQGCLSIPGPFGIVPRPAKVTMQAMDLEGKTFVEEFAYHNAQVVMHENDHLNGVLYIDRISPRERKAMEATLREIKKKYNH
ncbi:MAG: peptide deformylase [Parachlamydiaceae bacterium]|nr:peptide deformylase [Parachlamydiaceae bacterium]